MKKRSVQIICVVCLMSLNLFPQPDKKGFELPKLSMEQRWETAEGNLVYFIISGISYAKSKGQTAAEFGTWTGKIGCPYWKSIDSMNISRFVQEISANKQQFRDFQMEILECSNSLVRGRMKGYGLNWLKMMDWGGVTQEEYEQFFSYKWMAIGNCLGYDYKEEVSGEWTYFTVKQK